MKHHLKKHKEKKIDKKKEFYILADIIEGFYRDKKETSLIYTKHIHKAKKFDTKDKAMKYLAELSKEYSCECLSLIIFNSTEEKAIFLESLLAKGIKGAENYGTHRTTNR